MGVFLPAPQGDRKVPPIGTFAKSRRLAVRGLVERTSANGLKLREKEEGPEQVFPPSASGAPPGPGFPNTEMARFRSEPDGSRARQ